ncbi:hypothetical protein HZ326_5382 [Fusarium oxysporum f. sp. albedinis]|jgi:hypothetical protein|nr:hypothetical protein HZ326_5382 [Fusarium oxysporum f. sp. albedinis]
MEGILTDNPEDKEPVVPPKKENKAKSLVEPLKNENTKKLAAHLKEVELARRPIEEDLIGFSDDETSDDRPSKKRPVDVSEDHEIADLPEKKKSKKF